MKMEKKRFFESFRCVDESLVGGNLKRNQHKGWTTRTESHNRAAYTGSLWKLFRKTKNLRKKENPDDEKKI